MAYPKIIAVDFDGTLCENAWPNIGKPNYKIINYIQNQKKQGVKVILWTCRRGDMLEEAVNWCWFHGIDFDAVNENLPDIIKNFGGDTRKVFANEYIDDKNSSLAMERSPFPSCLVGCLMWILMVAGTVGVINLVMLLFRTMF